jgi:hypothetical protein
LKKTLMGLAALAALAVPSAASADSAKKSQSVDCTGGTITFNGSDTLWPPNHKFRDYSVVATPDVAQDYVTLTSTITNDEVVDGEELNGAGNTAVDATNNPGTSNGQGTQTVRQSVRGERSGRGDGRVYTFTVDAGFGLGAIPCQAKFTVTVPHDQRA